MCARPSSPGTIQPCLACGLIGTAIASFALSCAISGTKRFAGRRESNRSNSI